MQQVSGIFQLTTNVLDYFIVLYYFSLLSEKRHGRKIVFYLVGLVYIAAITYANQVIGNPWINLLVSIVSVVGISTFYEKKKEIGNLIIYDAIYIAINVAVEIFALCIVKIFLNSADLRLKETYICVIIVGRILVICFCYQVAKNKTRRQGVLAKEIEILLCVSTIISIWIAVSLADKMTTYEGWHVSMYMGAAIGCIYLELILYFLLEKFQKMYYQLLENQQMEYESEKKEEYLNILEEKEKEIRSIRHDLKNQLLELNVRLDSNNMKNMEGSSHEQAKEFVNNLIETLEEKDKYTGNFIINSILKEKIKCAREKGISVTYEIQIADTFQLERGDMGIILGNLLDNAIEASEQVEDPCIFIQMRQRNKSLYLFIENSTRESEEKEFVTTKADKKNHGFGLVSVQKTVEKYNGNIQLYRKEGRFIAELALMEK